MEYRQAPKRVIVVVGTTQVKTGVKQDHRAVTVFSGFAFRNCGQNLSCGLRQRERERERERETERERQRQRQTDRQTDRQRETQTQTQMVYCLQVLKTFNNFAAYNRIYIYIISQLVGALSPVNHMRLHQG